MKIKIVIFLLIFAITDTVMAQSDSLLNLTRKITYYENGQPRKLVTYLNDSCEYLDDYGIPEYNDYCREGFYQEWFSNGQIKISGQYKYEWCYDTILVANPTSGKLDTTIINFKTSIKTGIWKAYDSIGNNISTSRYIGDRLVARRYPWSDTTITISQDSVWIKLKDYSVYNSYLIKRGRNNEKLILQFPVHNNHNYWKIYNYKFIDLLYDDYLPYYFHSWDNALETLLADDCHDEKQYFFDFAGFPDGRYYIYYWSFSGIYYELEIILNEI